MHILKASKFKIHEAYAYNQNRVFTYISKHCATPLNQKFTVFHLFSTYLGTDTDRTFHPGSLSGVQLNQEWLLGK